MRFLGPDSTWLDEYDIPPETVMAERLRNWLAAGLKDMEPGSEKLKPMDRVHRDNRSCLRELLDTIQPAVLAWCHSHGNAIPEIWNTAERESSVWNMLLEEGQTDFDPIDVKRLLEWLAQKRYWPEEMPLTLDLADLNLTEEALKRAQTEDERERAYREFLRRSIELGGIRHSAAHENFAALAEAARASVTESLLGTRSGFSPLAEPLQGSRQGRRGKGTKAVKRNLTESQRSAIGLVGEVVALEWLRRRYPGATDDSWKSGYRDFVLGGSIGNDFLGFDFEVPVSRTSYLFEVKATSGDEMLIELGESEVLTAQKHASTDRYRILYIPFALNPVRRAIHVLPNPFAERGRDLYQLVGSGLRYNFLLRSA